MRHRSAEASTDTTVASCLHELFREQVRKTPGSLAVAGSRLGMTYQDLDHLSDRLAMRLIHSGAARDRAVGIYLERCEEYVIAMLAALKSGAAFLPIEPAYPRRMLEKILADSRPVAVLTRERYTKDLPKTREVLTLDEGWEAGFEDPEDMAPPPQLPQTTLGDLAFISYSSGTTGEPKGIANSHRAAVGSYLWRFGVDAPESFDRVGCNVFFIWEALRPLLRGAACVVIPDDEIYDPDALVAFLERHGVTETLVTPSLLETLLSRFERDLATLLPDLHTLWLNGEVVTRPLAARASSALPGTRLLNVYSISEAHEVAAGDLRDLARNPDSTYCPVGSPLDPENTHVLDEDLAPVPEGEPGELFVGGDLLARGYVNLPQKTSERFLEDPFSPDEGARLYRTGDRARLLADGSLEVLGRCDFMVKVRGYSVELGAVETAIEESLPVKGCVVVPDGEEGEDRRLVAYLVPSESGVLPRVDPKSGRSAGIRSALRESLPHYALPAAFVVSGSLPLQETTGKVDRDRLPPPPVRSGRGARSVDPLPEDASLKERERALAAVFEVVLRLDEGDVGARDDFFEIGGHSLAAAEVLAKIEEVAGVRLPVATLLEASTPAELAPRLLPDTATGPPRTMSRTTTRPRTPSWNRRYRPPDERPDPRLFRRRGPSS